MAEQVDSQSNVSPWASGFADSLTDPLSRVLARRDTSKFLSLTVPAAVGIPVLAEIPDGCLYSAVPAAGQYSIGLGTAGAWTASGRGRLARLARRARVLASGWDEETLVPGLASGRQTFFGYAFHPDDETGPLPNSLLRMPRLLYRRRDGHATLTLNVAPQESARRAIDACLAAADVLADSLGTMQVANRRPVRVDRNHAGDSWIQRVRGALDSIEAGELEKVVLTRKLAVQLNRRPRLGQALAAVASDYPGCAQMLIRHGGTCFVSISPERLVSIEGKTVVADGLAGSAPRAPESEADNGLGRALLADAKSRREHDVVVREIRRELNRQNVPTVAAPEPELLKLPSVQHLWTRVRGTRPENLLVLDLVAGLHPTPAVGGTPRREALAWLAEQGEARRGWYTGGAGWVSPTGEGTIWVLLRCAVCRGTKAELFAGAGIVSSSDPDWELGETGWKLAPMLEVLALA